MTDLVKNRDQLFFMRREALRAGGWTPELRDYLNRNGLSIGACIAHAGFINIALVKFLGGRGGDRVFLFDAEGRPAAVIEALLFDARREAVCADLVAWPLTAPEMFFTAMGLNDGADVLGPVSMIGRGGKPLVIHRTPLAWLKAGGDGCVLLKPGARHWLRKAGGPFVVEDVEHGQEVRELLGLEGKRHRILVPENTVRAA